MAGELSGGLYLVATPIGTARDITLRALDILRDADLLAAEDTRQARKLMEIHGVPMAGRQVLPYHDHNGAQQRPRILAALAEGQAVAYVSDAGTPLIADPGYRLTEAAISEGFPVTSAPGASALLAALSVAGMPTDRFLFAGFPPPKGGARLAFLEGWAAVPATLVFYESPKRLGASLAAMADAFGPARRVAVCRELTKRFEEVRRGSLEEMASLYEDTPPKGEIVVVVAPPELVAASGEDLDTALLSALKGASVRDAAAEVSEALGVPRKRAYARALELLREADA
ncbi:16S rRNA (cytidine(1402)-2'-O)-methyltransferase [Algicella marina]|uniref:Ribosomal RNA small subunit methyltransferase I n=1 Tax=Algicella marina TaxID=2683284 RepID=A0A6P1T377_9RHOB|nr:16S rRNA (cytidine(1402)-2'-O)-methyltransferase [Algicella marina]QHQ35926.1 16S rRNA (cytidine(1402)-2'-O)-methyltransferase [Algicella marina]